MLFFYFFRRHITTKHNISIEDYGSKYENPGPVIITQPPPVENKLLPPGPAIATASATNLLQQQQEEQKSAVLSRTSFILQQAGVGLKPNIVVVTKPQEEIIIKVNYLYD